MSAFSDWFRASGSDHGTSRGSTRLCDRILEATGGNVLFKVGRTMWEPRACGASFCRMDCSGRSPRSGGASARAEQ